MDIDLFDFDLPQHLIAQTPSLKRDESRLLAINNDNKTYEDKIFHDIVDYLKPGDVLVRNNTKVIPARLFGHKEQTNAHVEVLLLHQIQGDVWECLCGNAKPIKVGSVIDFKDGLLKAKCLEVKEEGIRIMEFIYDGIFMEILNEICQACGGICNGNFNYCRIGAVMHERDRDEVDIFGEAKYNQYIYER